MGYIIHMSFDTIVLIENRNVQGAFSICAKYEIILTSYPLYKYMLKVNNKNKRKSC